MDPKMDSGCLQPGEALVDQYDIERPLLPEELLGIMDQFLSFEMAWHEGYPLAQTLFSSHYIDVLLSLEAKTIDQIHFCKSGKNNAWSAPLLHVVLRAYCIAVVKCCDYALEEINRSLDGGGTRCNFYEEEDFSCHTYGRELFTRIPLDAVTTLLNKAIEFMEAERSYSAQGKRTTSSNIYEALIVRLNLRLSLLHAMAAETEFEDKITFWKNIPHFITPVKKTHDLGQPVPSSFSPKIQRRLASTVPPKPMVEMKFLDAIANLEQMRGDCQEALRIINFGPDNVQALKAFLFAFSSRKPESWTYPRACLATPLFTCDDAGFEQLLRRDLENLVFPASEVLDPTNWTIEAPQGNGSTANRRFELVKIIDQFTNITVRMPGGYVDFFRCVTSNRCRVRRNMTHVAVALEELRMRETEQLDARLHELTNDGLQYPLSTWTYLQKIRVMEWTVQLGFELDIYLPDELAGMYWYLSLLASSRVSLLDLILQATEARSNQMREDITKRKEMNLSLSMLRSLKTEAQGTVALASALSSIYIYLSYHGCVPIAAAKSPFYQPQLNYELRMKPFLSIKSPELPSFEEWDSVLHPFGGYDHGAKSLERSRITFLDGIDEHIKSAKMHFAAFKKLGAVAAGCEGLDEIWAKNTSVLLQSCIATGIALSALKGASSGMEIKAEIPKPGKGRYHDWWIVPKIT